jgi:hypothetical protein
VNDLVAQQAELAAYLRGTESRVVAEIAALLNPEQQRRFAALRTQPAPVEPPPAAPPAAGAEPEELPSTGV